MKTTIEIAYVQHCDEPECALGTADWDCPKCGAHNEEYGDFFYDEFEKEHKGVLECEGCKAKFDVEKQEWNGNNHGVYDIISP